MAARNQNDGFRILAWKQGEQIKVLSRRGADFTDRFQGIADAVRGVDEAIIDDEAVVFRPNGHSGFAAFRMPPRWRRLGDLTVHAGRELPPRRRGRRRSVRQTV
jgi:bifunctional non-homologous end joining protein LigD